VEVELPRMVISEAAAVAGVTPCPARAADRPLARVMAWEITTIDKFAPTKTSTIRGAISLTE
jgi:hypothetical protein